jgi:hypothetical protein
MSMCSRAHDGVVQIALGDAEAAREHIDIGALGGKLRAQRIESGLRIVDGRLAHEMSLEQLDLPVVVALRVGEIHLGFGEAGLGIVELGIGLIEGRADIGIIELGDDLAGFDVIAFLDVEFDHFRGDLGCHSRLAPRHHIARGVEDRACRGCAAGNGLGRDDVDGDAGRVQPRIGTGRDHHQCRRRGQPNLALAAGHRGVAAIDAQLIQESGLVIHAKGSFASSENRMKTQKPTATPMVLDV